jgi:hypothetical protein
MSNNFDLTTTPCKDKLVFTYYTPKPNSVQEKYLPTPSELATKILNFVGSYLPRLTGLFFAKISIEDADGAQKIYWINRSQIASTFGWRTSNAIFTRTQNCSPCEDFEQLQDRALAYFRRRSS